MNSVIAYQQQSGVSAEALPAEVGSWRDAVDRFLSEADIKESSKSAYGKALGQFFAWVEQTDRMPALMTRSDIIAFKEDLSQEGNRHSVMTIRLYISAVRRFYAWCEENSICRNIARSVKLPRIKETFIKQHLSKEESLELLSAVEADWGSGRRKIRFRGGEEVALRNFAIVNLMLRTGLRTIEISRLDVGDITMRRGKRIMMVWGKGRDSKDDFVPLNDKAYDPIDRYLAVRGATLLSEPLFSAAGTNTRGKRLTPRLIQMVCKEALRSIGLDDHAYSAHSLRHTCAVQILKNGGTMFDVKSMLRHARPETSELYVKSVEEEMRLLHSPDIYLENAYDQN